uniref:Uncharacterized protein n=1 Tax=Junco hyemalis TaxID=40217 RepID=A0A8C5JDL5_JUNHY
IFPFKEKKKILKCYEGKVSMEERKVYPKKNISKAYVERKGFYGRRKGFYRGRKEERFLWKEESKERFLWSKERFLQRKERFLWGKERFQWKEERFLWRKERFLWRKKRFLWGKEKFIQSKERFLRMKERLIPSVLPTTHRPTLPRTQRGGQRRVWLSVGTCICWGTSSHSPCTRRPVHPQGLPA